MKLVEVLLVSFGLAALAMDAPGLGRWVSVVGLLVRLGELLYSTKKGTA